MLAKTVDSMMSWHFQYLWILNTLMLFDHVATERPPNWLIVVTTGSGRCCADRLSWIHRSYTHPSQYISIVWSRTATPLDQRYRKPKLNLHSAYAASARTKVGNTANCAGQGVMFHLAICTCVIYCHICCIGCLYLFVLSGMEGALQRMWRSQRARHPPICCTWIRSRHVWESRQHVCDIWQDRLAGRGVFHAPRVGDSPGEPCQAWAQMYRRSSNNDFFDCRDNNSSAGYLDVDCEWVHRYLSDVWGCFLFKPGHQIRSFSGAKKLMSCVILTWCKFFKC